jgi:PHS family inorganic phosphate transporter-like MFS transporter
MSALKQTLRSRILKIAFVKDLRVLFKMAFTTHLNGNIGACALSMALLNYNCAITSYVLMLRDQFSAIDSVTYTLAAISILVGLVIGQLMFGMFGDVLGRRKSFFGSAILMLSGSILSIFSGYLFLGTDWTMIEFSICRIILGVGAGGMYPIVAAITRESSQEEIANTTVALVFGPFGSAGIIFAPIIVYMITIIPFFNNDTRWRLLLAVGAMSTIFLMFMEVEETLDRRPGQGQPKYPILERDAHETVLRLHRFGAAVRKLWDELFLALKTPIMREYLIGTSLSWFFSDILHCKLLE